MKPLFMREPHFMRELHFMREPRCIAALLLALAVLGCQGTETPVPPPAPNIRPEFQTNPPIASEVFIQKLENNKAGNLKLEAVFEEAEYAKIRADSSEAFAIELDDQKIVLWDNGVAPDEKAGDRIFTAVLTDELAELEGAIETANKSIREADKSLFRWFELRRLVQPKRDLRPFELDRFRAGQRVRVTDLLKFLRLLPPANLFENSLVITDLGVIEDPTRTIPNPCAAAPGDENKAWTFAKLMTEMANTGSTGVSPVNFTLQWLQTWSNLRTVNGENITAKAATIQQLIDTWDVLDGALDGNFQMQFAPFKLIAIVNRMDLRKSFGYGGGDAGEGRFVFCAVRRVGGVCVPVRDFTIIFEYGINKKGCSNVKAYAQQWYNLTTMPVGTPAYNAALQAVTDQFTLANTNPSKPNGSSINQIRTNEISLGTLWELLEFNICNP
ncbi:MAG: hypothetical protein JNK89_10480, partial [Saprospiraceae bacterium]|nr:hypothetical protein [Saprospiraceae bacterium]